MTVNQKVKHLETICFRQDWYTQNVYVVKYRYKINQLINCQPEEKLLDLIF